MINSKEDMKYYVECDLRSLGCYPLSFKEKWGGTAAFHMEISDYASEDGISRQLQEE